MKTWRNIKIIYSKIEHVSCLIHGLHRVVEKIRKYFSTVDQQTSTNILKYQSHVFNISRK